MLEVFEQILNILVLTIVESFDFTFVVLSQLVLRLFEFAKLILLVDKLAFVQVLQLFFALVMSNLKFVHLLLILILLLSFLHL